MRDALSRALNTIWPSSIGLKSLPDDGQNLRLLYSRAITLRGCSPLADLDLLDVAIEMMREAVEQSDTDPPLEVQLAVVTAIQDLMAFEALVEPDIDWHTLDTNGYEAMRLRQFLKDQIRFFEDYEANMDRWRDATRNIFSGLLSYLPSHQLASSEDDAGFPVSVIDLLETPDDAIERLVFTPFEDEFRYAGLFRELRERFDSNALIASGIDPRDRHETKKQITLPTDYRADTPLDLVQAYARNTPFASFFTHSVPYTIPESALFEHCMCFAGTGHGKTQLLQKLIFAQLQKAQKETRSIVVIDSQGDLIRKLARLSLFDPDDPASLADKLVLIDPSDVEWPVSLNIFDVKRDRIDSRPLAEREKHLNGIIELYENFFGSLLGAELTQRQGVIFKYLARLMMEIPDANIFTLRDLMDDPKPYTRYMKQLTGSARYFFDNEFFDKGFAATKKQIAKRLWGVLATPAFERMFGQRENKVDLYDLMNAGSIILIDTSKDLLKQEGCELFGRFFISMIMQAALERSVIEEHNRTPTLLYVDEASEYFDENFEVILNQARKYKIGLTCASQHLNQLSPRLRAAMLANTSIKIAGGINVKDGEILAAEMHTTRDFLKSMKKRRDTTEFALWVKHATPGALRISVPLGFLERQPTLLHEQYDDLRTRMRERYCQPLADLEQEWASRFVEEPPEQPQAAAAPPEPEAAEEQPPESIVPPPPPAPPATSGPTSPPELGRGGRQHTYLQQFIKGLGEQHGWHATIEAPTENAEGFIDVALLRGDERIACEVSVTTSSEHEVSNIRKCLAAGYTNVWAVLHHARQIRTFKRRLQEHLSEAELARVTVLRADELPDSFAALDVGEIDREETVRGRRVRVKRVKGKLNEAADRRKAVAKVIARSLQGREDT